MLVEVLSTRLQRALGRPYLKDMIFNLTWLCNSRCVTCGIWEWPSRDPTRIKGELGLKEIESLFASRSLGTLRKVYLTGGEPLLRPDILDIITIIHKHLPHASISITTSGLTPQTPEKIDKILKTGVPLHLTLSLNGPPEVHDYSRGVSGNYQRVVDLIDRFKTYPQTSSGQLTLGVIFTIFPFNVSYITYGAQFAHQRGIGIDFNLGRNEGERFWKYGPKYETYTHNVNTILKEFEILLTQQDSIPKVRDTKIDIYYLSKIYRDKQCFTCHMGFQNIYIDPQGDVFACDAHDPRLLFGNLRDGGFDRLWNSPKANRIRQFINSYQCQPCMVDCSIRYSVFWSRYFQIIVESIMHHFLTPSKDRRFSPP